MKIIFHTTGRREKKCSIYNVDQPYIYVLPEKRLDVHRKIVFGVVPSKNDNRRPRQSGSSSLDSCLLCLPLCRAHCLSFRLKLSRMAT